MIGVVSFVDIGNNLSPLITKLSRIIATFNFRNFQNDRCIFIYSKPGFEIGHIQIGIHKFGLA